MNTVHTCALCTVNHIDEVNSENVSNTSWRFEGTDNEALLVGWKYMRFGRFDYGWMCPRHVKLLEARNMHIE